MKKRGKEVKKKGRKIAMNEMIVWYNYMKEENRKKTNYMMRYTEELEKVKNVSDARNINIRGKLVGKKTKNIIEWNITFLF